MDGEANRKADSEPVSFRIDANRRLVFIQVRENVPSGEVVGIYARIFRDVRYQPGYSLVVDRRGLKEPPTAETVRAVVDFLRQHAAETRACRMAIVTDEDAPRAAWRAAEMLAGHYTSVELRVFDDVEAAEFWATRGIPRVVS